MLSKPGQSCACFLQQSKARSRILNGRIKKILLLAMETIHENISNETLEAKNQHRDQIDLLRSRLYLLDGTEKVLMTMYIENGNSFRQIAQLLGVNETSIARKIHHITKRLISSEYIFCLRNRDKFNKYQIDIAKDYFLTGLSIKNIAAKRHQSYYSVRKTLIKIQNIIKTANYQGKQK
jgi:hypothetical protein